MKTLISGAAVATAVSCFSAVSQASIEGLQPGRLPVTVVDLVTMAGPNLDALEQEDLQRDEQGLPMRFAVPNEVSITPGEKGTWEHLPNGRMMWRLRVLSPGAWHINFGFGRFELPASGDMNIYSVDGFDIDNTHTAADNPLEGEYWTRIVQGEEVVIEISCDASDRAFIENNIELTSINEGYRGFEAPNTRGSSESCNVDVMCPLGDDWWDEIPSAGVYTISGSWTCSGGMLNNTNQDETPYFLTADHCNINTGNDQSVVVYWNHQNSTCRTGNSSGNNGNGQYNQYTSGSTFLVGNSTYDYTLIELNSSPNPSYQVTFSGWSRQTSTGGIAGGVCIHHPNTAEKRISSVQTAGVYGQYWRINWDEGRTYFGSSGSPLYNANHQVIGALCCGNSFCTNDDDDFFGRSIATQWNSLRPYLDPNNTGVSSLDTYNPYAGDNGVCCLQGNCSSSVDEATCTNVGGDWWAGYHCGNVDCNADPVGACCATSGNCSSQSEADCTSSGGEYHGDGSDCADVTCADPDPTGACCMTSGSCVDNLTASACSGAGGSYQGNSTTCANVNCDQEEVVSVSTATVGASLVSELTDDHWTVDVFAAIPAGYRVDAVAGNSAQQKMLTSTNGFYQHSVGGPTSIEVNPALYSILPDLEWDSRVTIGALDSSGDPFDSNNLGNVGIDWSTFEAGGDLSVDDGTWYILPSHAQGAAQAFTADDCSTQTGVLIARLTVLGQDSTVMFEGLLQGRTDSDDVWQDTVNQSFTYTASEDCNDNATPDHCDIANGTSQDANGNGIPDECESDCDGDADGDGDADVDDILAIISHFGGGAGGDLDGDGDTDVDDLLQCISYFGGC